jgi:hypothetical protein
VNPYGALMAASTLTKLTPAAGPGVGVAATARFGTDPGPIEAVHHSVPLLALSAAGIAAGLALMLAAGLLIRRTRVGKSPDLREQVTGPDGRVTTG